VHASGGSLHSWRGSVHLGQLVRDTVFARIGSHKNRGLEEQQLEHVRIANVPHEWQEVR